MAGLRILTTIGLEVFPICGSILGTFLRAYFLINLHNQKTIYKHSVFVNTLFKVLFSLLNTILNEFEFELCFDHNHIIDGCSIFVLTEIVNQSKLFNFASELD